MVYMMMCFCCEEGFRTKDEFYLHVYGEKEKPDDFPDGYCRCCDTDFHCAGCRLSHWINAGEQQRKKLLIDSDLQGAFHNWPRKTDDGEQVPDPEPQENDHG